MQLILSNYGHRTIRRRLREGDPETAAETRALAELLRRTAIPYRDDPPFGELEARGLVQRVGPELDAEAIRLRYARNPLEHLERVVFEYTTLCNLDCLHCRNGNIEARGEADPHRLAAVVDAVIPMGIRRFDFIGGEVTLYGRGWLDLVEHIRAYDETTAGVITSGWFLGEKDFRAADGRFANDRAYLAHLRERGLTHVVFSLDGPEELHDAWRQVPGLYRRVLDGLRKVEDAGLSARVSLVISPRVPAEDVVPWIAGIADRLYTFPASARPLEKAQRLISDDTNYVSNFIDVGSAVELRLSRAHVREIRDEDLRCKNFFRPSPTLRIKAGGEVSLCPLVDAGDGYGNVHERGIVHVLNHMQDAFVYKLHAERSIASYRRFVDTSIFGDHIAHVCSLRTVIAMIARAMEERRIAHDDLDTIRDVNVEVARRSGFLPQLVRRRANGHKRPA